MTARSRGDGVNSNETRRRTYPPARAAAGGGDRRNAASTGWRQAEPDGSAEPEDGAAMRGEVLPLGNSVLEDIQGTFS